MNEKLAEILNVAAMAKDIAVKHEMRGIDVSLNGNVRLHISEETFKNLLGEYYPTEIESLDGPYNRYSTIIAGIEIFYLKEKNNEQ